MTSSADAGTIQRREVYRIQTRVILLGMGPLPHRESRRHVPRRQRVTLSPKGVGVRTRCSLTRGETVYLDLTLPGQDRHIISCTATVAYNHPLPDGSFYVGLAFCEMTSADVVRIERFSGAVQRRALRQRAQRQAASA